MTEQQPPESAATPDLVAGVKVPAAMPGALALPATGIEVAQFVAFRAAACVGADYSNMAVFDAVGQSLRLFHGAFLTPEHRRPVHGHSSERTIPDRRGGSLRQGCPAP